MGDMLNDNRNCVSKMVRNLLQHHNDDNNININGYNIMKPRDTTVNRSYWTINVFFVFTQFATSLKLFVFDYLNILVRTVANFFH